MKTSELIGPSLDWAVAKCEGVQLWRSGMFGKVCVPTDDTVDFYSPTTDWAQGGPIIEREKITTSDALDAWAAGYRGTLTHFGPTPLIAAMRCYVASKLGDEVEIPKELYEN